MEENRWITHVVKTKMPGFAVASMVSMINILIAIKSYKN